ncbi:hypothetical protein [Cellulosimicrobium protaetiae]|uniref:Uncharacterized protein n=1 Tax=Cellulosimicrobium protaetiae TaxID=2587808 RepID=A0A6M5UBV7_9MICO|nr:hypothetical protein [Cellulosimicrobium protaetiae]QJW34891.1 hypothetical protein FIC82_000415 [Cellulosimicrobium protaetiae]
MLVAVPLAPAWLFWVGSVVALAAGLRRTGLVLACLAAAAGVVAVGALVAAERASVAFQEGDWVTAPGHPLTLAADVAILAGVAVLLVAVRPVRQAAPVLAGVLTALILSSSDLFWSGAVDATAVNLGNLLGAVALSAAVTPASRWVVNRLDELAASRATHRALLVGAMPGPAAPHPGEPTAV